MRRAAFLDRDGVINRKARDGEYVTRWEDLHFLPGIAEAIAQLNQAEFSVIVVTNQRCVAKGLITQAELENIHKRMLDHLASAGAKVDAIYYCPHETGGLCNCRKPEPGMLLEAARSRNLDLASSWMIGDSEIDIQAGKKAGCKTVQLLEKNLTGDVSGRNAALASGADVVAPSLIEAIPQILRFEHL
jgi:D-glycero-D-manno-heptose 1,7-bisphosphate phosphatase